MMPEASIGHPQATRAGAPAPASDPPPAMPAPASPAASAWAPLARPLFRAMWLANLAVSIGVWMQNVAGAWAMTSLASSPVQVSLMQTAANLPMLLLGLPAGALADIVDRRRLLLATQLWMLLVLGALALLDLTDTLRWWSLLGLTFALGVGSALNLPAYQASVPELVGDPAILPAAVALNAVSVNGSRAIGPALGGAIVARWGAGWVFLVAAATYLGTLLVVARWRRRPAADGRLPAEHLGAAVRAGIRYARYTPSLRSTLARAAIFIAGAAAPWALLPTVARTQLGLDAVGYGALFTALGAGAILGTLLLPRVRLRLAADRLALLASLLFAGATLTLALGRSSLVVGVALVIGGMGWVWTLSTLNVSVLVTTPRWAQARAVGLYMVVFMGGMAAASAGWGALGARLGTPAALGIAAAAVAVGAVVNRRWPIPSAADLAPAVLWQEPAFPSRLASDEGPVLVLVEYRVPAERRSAFGEAMRAIADLRRRDGAVAWRLYHDPADPATMVETYSVASWTEHLRQQARVTTQDAAAFERVRALTDATTPPVARHLVGQGA